MICSTPTLAELVTLYGVHHPCLDKDSLNLYGYARKSLEKFYGYELRACDFSDDLMLPWLSHRLGERAAKTVRRERGDLLTLWRFSFKRGLCSQQPIDVPTVKVPRKNPNSWTISEYTRLIDTCRSLTGEIRGTGIKKSLWWESLTTFLYWIGCRIGAALAVETSDIFLDRRLVRLKSEDAKTNLEQILLMHPQAVAAVKSMLSPDRKLVWPYPFGRRRIWEHYKAILQRAGLPTDREHMFQKTRRTTYTMCVKYGSKEIASKQLGHKTDMSRYYLDESQLLTPQAADVLPLL